MGTLWEIDAETPAALQRADFPAIYEDPVTAAEVLPGAFSVERDASGSHTDMMLTIGHKGVSISLPPSTRKRCRYPTRCGGGDR